MVTPTGATTRSNAPDPGLNGASRAAGDSGISQSGLVTPDCVSNLKQVSAGVDTWRLGFKVGRRPLPLRWGTRFEVGRYRAEWFPNHSLVALEGHPLETGLCPGELLGDLFEQLHEEVQEVCGRAEPYGVLRLDSTAETNMGERSRGLAVLRGMAAVVTDAPGLKPSVFGKPVETVYLHSKRGRGAKLGRGYDPWFKGQTARGEAVRFEAQDRRLDLDYALSAGTPRERFHRRFGPLWRASQTVTVGGFPKVALRLAELIDAGELTAAKASQLFGFLGLQMAGREDQLSRTTSWRRRRELLEHGIALADDGLFEPVEVNLGEAFEVALSSADWN